MKRNIYIAGGIIMLIIVAVTIWGGTLFTKYAPDEYMVQNESGTTTINTTTGNTTSGAKTFTAKDVEAHKDQASCYSTISGTVYDLTMWVNAHPGGKNPILFICGKDGTDVFMNKHHAGQKFMTILDRFKIGTLAQ